MPVQTGSLIQPLIQPAGTKHGMCMAVQLYMQSEQNALHALVGYEDGTVAVWDVAASSLLASKQLHTEPVMAVAVAADGSGISLPGLPCILWLRGAVALHVHLCLQ